MRRRAILSMVLFGVLVGSVACDPTSKTPVPSGTGGEAGNVMACSGTSAHAASQWVSTTKEKNIVSAPTQAHLLGVALSYGMAHPEVQAEDIRRCCSDTRYSGMSLCSERNL